MVNITSTGTDEDRAAALVAHGHAPVVVEETPAPAAEAPKSDPAPAAGEPAAREELGETAPASEPEKKTQEPVAVDTPAEPKVEKTEEKEEHKKGGGFQRRIERFKGTISTLESENAKLAEEVERLKSGKPDPVVEAPKRPEPPARPQRPKFDPNDYEASAAAIEKYENETLPVYEAQQSQWLSEAAKFDADQRFAENMSKRDREAAERAEAEAARARQERWDAGVEKCRERHDDLDELEEAVNTGRYLITDSVGAAVNDIEDADVGAEVIYFLWKNPEEAERISRLTLYGENAKPSDVLASQRIAAREITKIATKIQAEMGAPASKPAATTIPPVPKAPPAKPKPASSAPAPITPLAGNTPAAPQDTATKMADLSRRAAAGDKEAHREYVELRRKAGAVA